MEPSIHGTRSIHDAAMQKESLKTQKGITLTGYLLNGPKPTKTKLIPLQEMILKNFKNWTTRKSRTVNGKCRHFQIEKKKTLGILH
jgi:hypothetical protein